MVKITEITDCKFAINSIGVLVYVQNYNIYYHDFVIQGKYYSITVDENMVYTYDNGLNQTQFFDVNNGKLLYSNKNFVRILPNKHLSCSNVLFGQYEDAGNEFWIEFDIERFEILKKYPLNFGFNGIHLILSNFSFLSYNGDKIGVYNKEELLLWQLNFCDLLQNDRAILHSEIIEQEGKLYFVLDGAENRGTFCVDIESGEVLAKYTALQGWLVKDGDYIYTIRFSETVVRLDTRTNEIVEWDIQELNGIGLIAEVAQNGFIYFVQNIGVTDPKVGVLDFDNRELVWSYSFTGNHGLIGSIKVHGNRLFVHTQDNTLHIFEKEL